MLQPAWIELGRDVAQRAWTEGRGRTLPEAVALAIDDNRVERANSAHPAERTTLGDGALTERESEVLRLLASGVSNREIATALVLSIRTVERHIANVYAKIGARGRADAAKYAFEHALPLTIHSTPT